jgi:phosphoglycerate dehydrogenase-like enzyme
VFRDEPLPAGHPFRTLDNLILTRHFARGAVSTVVDEVVPVFSNVRRILRSHPPWLVNRIPAHP